mgnify:CR=1 FL=1
MMTAIKVYKVQDGQHVGLWNFKGNDDVLLERFCLSDKEFHGENHVIKMEAYIRQRLHDLPGFELVHQDEWIVALGFASVRLVFGRAGHYQFKNLPGGDL